MLVSVEMLSAIQLFVELSPQTQTHIAEKAMLAEYPAKVDLYRQGDPPSPLFMLLSGRVKLYRQSKDKRQILALPVPGEVLGAESLPTDAHHSVHCHNTIASSCCFNLA